ncbi:hypothetical protein PG999_008154 [Apiospora kogelbergensis]|uniref:Uncharacterized protein n=1 Tax=Apiospora kogelbergensis TaxID=1337665 RepID=A0AAW0QN40_9PEZI
MESRNALDNIHRDDFLMGLVHGTTSADVTKNQQQPSQQGMTAITDMFSQKANFSYPRPDSRVIRHEPTVSRSSMTSNGSVPGMTDASDSEASADDDFHYNASASELWDSFWPNDASRIPSLQQPQGSSSPSLDTSDYFTATTTPLERLEDDDTITLSSAERSSQQLKAFQWPLPNPRSSRVRPVPTRSPATTTSVCPRTLQEGSTSSGQTSIPARSTSLAPEAPRQQHLIKRKPLRSSKSIANLSVSKPRPHLHPLYEAPTASTSNSTIIQDIQSLPVSPAYSEPPSMSLRPSASAFDMRRQHAEDAAAALYNKTHHNATAPLAPLPPRAFQQLEQQQPTMAQRPARPQMERNVSVFECDSDDDSDYEAESKFVRRLTRGLQHKKSTIGGGERSSKTHGASTLSPPTPSGRASRDGSETRKRGGSLGRILGLKSRSSS